MNQDWLNNNQTWNEFDESDSSDMDQEPLLSSKNNREIKGQFKINLLLFFEVILMVLSVGVVIKILYFDTDITYENFYMFLFIATGFNSFSSLVLIILYTKDRNKYENQFLYIITITIILGYISTVSLYLIYINDIKKPLEMFTLSVHLGLLLSLLSCFTFLFNAQKAGQFFTRFILNGVSSMITVLGIGLLYNVLNFLSVVNSNSEIWMNEQQQSEYPFLLSLVLFSSIAGYFFTSQLMIVVGLAISVAGRTVIQLHIHSGNTGKPAQRLKLICLAICFMFLLLCFLSLLTISLSTRLHVVNENSLIDMKHCTSIGSLCLPWLFTLEAAAYSCLKLNSEIIPNSLIHDSSWNWS